MKYLPILSLCLVILSSCSRSLTPYTEALVQQNDWSQSELERIQFYNSEDIILTRELTSREADIVKGKIKMENGIKLEEVLIAKGTPGVVVVNPKGDRIGVSFEAGRDDLFLMWGPMACS